jgi:Domain of unknown function (DUF4386)
MSIAVQAPPKGIAASSRVRQNPMRKTAFMGGALYLLTFISSIPAAAFFLLPVLNNADYIVSSGADGRVIMGCLLDVINALACIGTAVVLFPVVKRQNETLALGFVTSRLLEAAVIATGVVSILAVVSLRQDLAGATGAEATAMVVAGQSLVAVRDWTLLLGPGLLASVNALLLGTLMYRSRLVPRVIPLMGLIGAPLLIGSVLATLFGVFDQFSPAALMLVLPVAAWEFSLGVWLVVKGFRPSRISTEMTSAGTTGGSGR